MSQHHRQATRTRPPTSRSSDAGASPLLPLSPSKLAAFDGGRWGTGCGLRGKLKYLDKIPEPEGIELQIGSLVHTVMLRYAVHCCEKHEAAAPGWLAAAAAGLGDSDAALAAREILAVAGERVSFPVIANSRYVVEYDLAIRRDGRPAAWDDCWWRGRLDFARVIPVDGGEHLVVRDWKTDRVVPPPSAPADPALLDYAYAAGVSLTETPPIEVTVELHFLRYGAVRSWTFPWAEIADRPRAIQWRHQAILQAGFAPNLGWHCGWCNYQGQCEAYTRWMRAVPPEMRPPGSAEEARGLATQLFVLKDWTRKMEEMMRSYCGEHGDVETADDMLLGYAARTERHVPGALKMAEWLRDVRGLPVAIIWQHLSVAVGTVEKLLRAAGRKGKAVAEDIATLTAQGLIEETGTRVFKFRRKATEADAGGD